MIEVLRRTAAALDEADTGVSAPCDTADLHALLEFAGMDVNIKGWAFTIANTAFRRAALRLLSERTS